MIVGVIGAGQLARMMALAGVPLGMKFVFLDPAPDACAGVAGELLVGAYDDPSMLDAIASKVDLITFDFENVPESSVCVLADRVPSFPPARALGVSQDRLREKTLFRQIGLPTAKFASVGSLADLESAVCDIGLPAVLKTRRFGYDGKGQVVLRSVDDLVSGWEAISGAPAILEAFVPFRREVSVIAVRGRDGNVAFYPLSENTHREGILRVAVSRPEDPRTDAAREMASQLMEELDYVGVLALEMFDTDSGLIANEFAPRVHNSGHWTTEGAQTSQFENHLRAVSGLPLGDTSSVGSAVMLNIVGEAPDIEAVLAVRGAHLHLYGKEPRPGRKIGHITVRSGEGVDLHGAVQKLLALPGVG